MLSAVALIVVVYGVSAFQPKNFRIQPPATDGEGLVPLPQKVQFGTTVYSLDPAVFQLFVHTSPLCDVVDSAAKRYLKILFQSGGEGKVKKFYDGETSSVAYRWLPVRQTDLEGLDNITSLKSLQVVISGKCEKYPYLGMNENCESRRHPPPLVFFTVIPDGLVPIPFETQWPIGPLQSQFQRQ